MFDGTHIFVNIMRRNTQYNNKIGIWAIVGSSRFTRFVHFCKCNNQMDCNLTCHCLVDDKWRKLRTAYVRYYHWFKNTLERSKYEPFTLSSFVIKWKNLIVDMYYWQNEKRWESTFHLRKEIFTVILSSK